MYDVSAIKVKHVTTGAVGKPVTFLVETSQAGPGNLEVTVNGGRVPTSAQAQGQHTYAISFTPRESQNHTVDLRFNGQDVPGSPFTCQVSTGAKIVAPETFDKVSVGQTFEFVIESDTMPQVDVVGPTQKSIASQIEPIDNGYKIRFEPNDVGDHTVDVRLSAHGSHIDGSPFILKAYSAEKVIVTDIKSGTFGVDTTILVYGTMEFVVRMCGMADIIGKM